VDMGVGAVAAQAKRKRPVSLRSPWHSGATPRDVVAILNPQ